MTKSEKNIIIKKIKDEAYRLDEIYQEAIYENDENQDQYGAECDEAFRILRIVSDLMEGM